MKYFTLILICSLFILTSCRSYDSRLPSKECESYWNCLKIERDMARRSPLDGVKCECMNTFREIEIVETKCNQTVTCAIDDSQKDILKEKSDLWDCNCNVSYTRGYCHGNGTMQGECEIYELITESMVKQEKRILNLK